MAQNLYKKGFTDGINHALSRKSFREDDVSTIKEMMASFGLVLHEKGYSKDDIQGMLTDVQSLWNNSVKYGFNVLVRFQNETGIDIEKEE